MLKKIRRFFFFLKIKSYRREQAINSAASSPTHPPTNKRAKGNEELSRKFWFACARLGLRADDRFPIFF